MKLPVANETITVEYYSATHIQGLLVGLASDATVGVEWLRYRKVLLSEALSELEGLTFDAFVLGDWSASGAAHWTTATTQGATTSSITSALARLSAVATPGAVVMPLGLADECAKAWGKGDTLLPFSDTEDLAVEGLPIFAVRLKGGRDLACPGAVVVLATEAETARQLAEAIAVAVEGKGRWNAHTLVSWMRSCGESGQSGGITLVVRRGSWMSVSLMGPLLLLGVTQVLDVDAMESEAVASAVEGVLVPLLQSGNETRFDGFVYVASDRDDSLYGKGSFERLRKVAQGVRGAAGS
jgi:hypothetical protein